MGFAQKIPSLCAKALSARDGSQELKDTMLELRVALHEHAAYMRTIIAEQWQKIGTQRLAQESHLNPKSDKTAAQSAWPGEVILVPR